MKNNTYSDNPIKRLLIFCDDAKKNRTTDNFVNGWCNIFAKVNPTDADIFETMVQFSELLNSCERSVRSLKGLNHDLYLEPIIVLRRILDNKNFERQWDSVTSLISEKVLYGLKITNDILSQQINYAEHDASEINSILLSIVKLIDNIKESDLPIDIKDFLLKHCSDLLLALTSYQYFGSEYAKNALEHTTGALILSKNQFITHWDNPAVVSFLHTLAAIANLATISSVYSPMFSEGIRRLLE